MSTVEARGSAREQCMVDSGFLGAAICSFRHSAISLGERDCRTSVALAPWGPRKRNVRYFEVTMRFRVLLVDDDEAALALAAALEDAPYQVLTARSAAEALEILEREDIQVVVSDEWMPGMRGVELLAQVAREYPYIVRILLTGDPQLDAAVRAINEGEIFRFLTKPCSSTVLDSVIREALIRQSRGKLQEDLIRVAGQGLEAIERIEGLSAGGGRADRLDTGAPEITLDQLSKREREIVETLLGEGSVTGVATTLHISLHTVRNHLKSIFRKLGVHSQVELVTKLKR